MVAASPAETASAADGVRRTLNEPLAHGLAPLLARCLPGETGPPQLLRSKYKPGKLTAYYDLDGQTPRHLALTWWDAPPQQPAPEHPLAAASPDGRVRLLVAPLDPAFPQLGRLHDPAYAGAVLAELTRSQPAARPQVAVIRYRPGQRHVLQVTGAGHAAVVKAYRDGTGSRTVATAQVLRGLLAERCPDAGPARCLGEVSTDRAVWWALAAGEPLWCLLRRPRAAARSLHLLGRAVRTIHDAPTDDTSSGTRAGDGTGNGGSSDPTKEARTTLRAAEHIAALLPDVGTRVAALVDRVQAVLAALPGEPPTRCHGDLKCDNVLATDDRLHLVDLDRAGLADPALDIAKLAVDLRWWGDALVTPTGTAVAAFLAGYGATDPARLARARAYGVLLHLRLTARRVPVHDPAWASRVTARVAQAEAVMASGGRA